MNFGQICTEVGQNMTSDDAPRIKQWVLDASNEIISRDDWSFLEVSSPAITLVSSQQAYVLNGSSPVVADFAGIIDVRLELTSSGARVPLDNLEVRDFDRLSDKSRVNGTPVFYTITGGAPPSAGSGNILSGAKQELLLWPIPTASAGQGVNVWLRYFRSTASVQMSADTDVPIIPIQFHSAIVKLAKSYALADDDQSQQSQLLRQQAEATIAAMQIEDARMRTGDRNVWAMVPQTVSRSVAPQPQQPDGK